MLEVLFYSLNPFFIRSVIQIMKYAHILSRLYKS